MQCSATCKNGKKCPYKAKLDGLCMRHHTTKPECAICLKELKQPIELSCSHRFHNKCITKWLKINSSCPICRVVIGFAEISKLNLNISRALYVINKVEYSIYKERASNLDLFLRYSKCYAGIIAIFNNAILDNRCIIRYLKKHFEHEKSHIDKLTADMKQIEVWVDTMLEFEHFLAVDTNVINLIETMNENIRSIV